MISDPTWLVWKHLQDESSGHILIGWKSPQCGSTGLGIKRVSVSDNALDPTRESHPLWCQFRVEQQFSTTSTGGQYDHRRSSDPDFNQLSLPSSPYTIYML